MWWHHFRNLICATWVTLLVRDLFLSKDNPEINSFHWDINAEKGLHRYWMKYLREYDLYDKLRCEFSDIVLHIYWVCYWKRYNAIRYREKYFSIFLRKKVSNIHNMKLYLFFKFIGVEWFEVFHFEPFLQIQY